MNKPLIAIAAPLALALSAGAPAADDNSAAVEKLKSSLPNTLGFKVEDARAGNEGATCITYTLTNDQNGQSRSRAVVQGDKVLHETTGNTRFAKAWNSQCATHK